MKFKSYKLKQKWLYLASIFAISLTIPTRVFAAGADDLIKLIAQFIWGIFVIPMTWLLRLELELLKIIASYNNFTHEGGVTIGWIALRDLSNMFFILILLIIAFATILRISSYGYQQLLKRTIIIAILINFSKTIVGFLIDIVQVVMLTFIAAIDNVMSGGVVVALGLHNLFSLDMVGGGSPPLYDYVIGLIMAAIFIMILIVVMGVIILMLTMRIVALWVVIVLSPLAFIASIFPATKSFYSKWTKELGANLVSGPMLAFFLWLTFTIVGNGEAYTTFMEGTGTDGPTEFLGTSNMVNYIVAIALLLTGIKQAAASGAAGASFASKGMGMIQSGASKFARRYPKALGMRVGSKLASGFIDKDGKAKTKLTSGRLKLAGKSFGIGKFKKTIGDDSRLGKVDVGLGKLAGKEMKWNRVPFYGGRLQRFAQKTQGKTQAMEKSFQTEDEKDILAQHKVQFEASQSEYAGVGGARGLYSKLSSFGGDKARKAMAYQNMLARGEITSENAEEATNALRDFGDEEGMQKIQMEHATYANKEEAVRLIMKSGGLAPVMTKLKSASFTEEVDEIDEKTGKVVIDPETGKPKKKKQIKDSANYLVDALTDPKHGFSDANTISQSTLKMDKVDRWLLNGAIKDRLSKKNSFAAKDEDGNFVDSKGNIVSEENATYNPLDNNQGSGIAYNKRGSFDVNLDNGDVTASLGVGKTYMNMLASVLDKKTGQLEDVGVFGRFWTAVNTQLKTAYIDPGKIGQSMPDLQGVDAVDMARRKELATDLDMVNRGDEDSLPDYLQGRFINQAGEMGEVEWDNFEDHRQDMYQQLTDIKPWTNDPEGERVDYGDQSHVFGEGYDKNEREEQMLMYAMMNADVNIPRSDIIGQKETLAKETKEGEAARKKVFSQATDPEEAEREYKKTMKNLRQIEGLRTSDAGKEIIDSYGGGERGEVTLEALIRRLSADAVGDKRNMYDPATRAFMTEMNDGMHGTRAMEVDVNNPYEAGILKGSLERFENQQQAQSFSVAAGDQAPFLLNTLAEVGKLPQKMLMDNSPKGQAAVAMQKYRDVNHFQNNGTIPQDLSVLGSNMKYLAAVIRRAALTQGFIKADSNGKISDTVAKAGVAKYLAAEDGKGKLVNGTVSKRISTLQNVYNEEMDYTENNQYITKVQDGGYNPAEYNSELDGGKVQDAAKAKKTAAAAEEAPKKPLFKEDSGLE